MFLTRIYNKRSNSRYKISEDNSADSKNIYFDCVDCKSRLKLSNDTAKRICLMEFEENHKCQNEKL